MESDLGKQEYEVAGIFLEVLGIEKISVTDDFFDLGGDSLLAVSLVTRLQRNYKINVSDIFALRTVAAISKFITSSENNLFEKLEQIKLKYTKKVSYSEQEKLKMFLKQTQYNEEVKRIVINKQKKKICNVLLTGATGHIGCNILYELLQETQYKVYLLIRAKSNDEAFDRISSKFKYYFNTDLSDYEDRIVILVSDIEKQALALDTVTYADLVLQIDSIIHSAALVKHYGEYDRLYQANVQATINLLELAKLTKGKDFHYISTLAVVVDGYIPDYDYYLINEDDDAGIIQNRKGVYARTKYEGELEVIKYREYGVKSNIYRPNNVAMHSQNYIHQENIGDNAFFNCFKTMLNFGMMPDELSIVEISPVDSVAKAIIKLFDQDGIDNQTYHIFNPHLVNLPELFAIEKNFNIRKCSINEFIDNIITKLSANKDTKQIELFMLHQLWLQEVDNEHTTHVEVSQNKTNFVLTQLGFEWPIVDRDMLSKMVSLSFIEGENK